MTTLRSSRHIVFASITAIILIIDACFVWVNHRAAEAELHLIQAERGRSSLAIFDQHVQAMYSSMLQLSHFVAHDPEIRAEYLAGRKAWLAGDKDTAAKHRHHLMGLLAPSWTNLQKTFHIRQLHFHIGPGDISYLRVHKPEKFGDDLSSIRHTIVDAITKGTDITGFESGRVYSGLRGVTPLFDEQGHAVGALEAGVSFRQILADLSRQSGQQYAVLLSEEYVRQTMWEDRIAKVFGTAEANNGFYVEARSDELIDEFLQGSMVHAPTDSTVHTHIHEVNGEFYALRSQVLHDYRTSQTLNSPGIGQVLSWENISETMARHQHHLYVNIIYAIAAFLIIELLIYVALRLATTQLHTHIEEQKYSVVKANERLKGFNHMVSHDLKNPLSNVLGFNRRARKEIAHSMDQVQAGELPDCKRLNNCIDAVERNARQMHDIVQGMLAYSETTESLPGRRVCSLDTIITEAEKRITNLVKDHQACLQRQHTAVDVYVEPKLFTQALVNLFSNSILYASPDRSPTIAISTETSTIWLTLLIEDNGRGIPEDELDDIFSKAKRGAQATDNPDGHGIGLHSVKRIIEDHGGRIRVESELGHGTRMLIDLPRIDQPSAAAESE